MDGQPVVENGKLEIRELFGRGIELRAAKEGSNSPGTLVGYSAVFDRYSEDLGYFREKISPGAFAKALKKSDVRALFNHDANMIIGRSSAGTLRLEEDELGLKAEIDLPDTQVGRDLAESIRRRDIQGQSFCFTCAIDEWNWSGEVVTRTVIEVDDLFDVGPVSYPAFSDSSVALRALHTQREQRAKAATQPPPIPTHVIQAAHNARRLRLLELSH